MSEKDLRINLWELLPVHRHGVGEDADGSFCSGPEVLQVGLVDRSPEGED